VRGNFIKSISNEDFVIKQSHFTQSGYEVDLEKAKISIRKKLD
jgi:hypothetical protein